MAYTPMQLAEAFIQTGELTDALDALNQQLEAHPEDDDARRMRAQVLMRMPGADHVRAALNDLEGLVSPTNDDELRRVIALEHAEEYAKAAEVVGKLYASDPQNERIAERYFGLLMRERQFTTAEDVLKQMPRSWDWLARAGDLATENGNEPDAPGYYTEALRLLGNEFDLANDAFARPIQVNLLMARGGIYATLKQFEAADADYQAAEVLMPNDPMIPFWRSIVLADLGRVDEAMEVCRAALTSANATLKATMIETLETLRPNAVYGELVKLVGE